MGACSLKRRPPGNRTADEGYCDWSFCHGRLGSATDCASSIVSRLRSSLWLFESQAHHGAKYVPFRAVVFLAKG